MYKILSLVLLFTSFCFAQKKVVLINAIEFNIDTTVVNDTVQTQFFDLYKDGKKVLTHILSDFDGDCSSKNIELGAYEIEGDFIILYSYWASADRMGKNIYPYGFKKQVYFVNSKGVILQKSSEIYIESYVDSWSKHKGINFLNKEPSTPQELAELEDYVSKAEVIWEGYFVRGKNKDDLEKQVRAKLKSEISNNTSYWAEVYGDNYKM